MLIPAHLLTAVRLWFGPPDACAAWDRVVFVGPVPDPWLLRPVARARRRTAVFRRIRGAAHRWNYRWVSETDQDAHGAPSSTDSDASDSEADATPPADPELVPVADEPLAAYRPAPVAAPSKTVRVSAAIHRQTSRISNRLPAVLLHFPQHHGEPHGTLLHHGKLLVQVRASKHTVSHAREKDTTTTTVARRWREFVVVVRAGSPHPRVQFYRSRSVRNHDTRARHESLDFVLSPHCSVSVFSPMDHLVAVCVPGSPTGTTVYVLKAQSPSESARWHAFLYRLSTGPFADRVDISVPDLDLALSVRLRGHALAPLPATVLVSAHGRLGSMGTVANHAVARCMRALRQLPAGRLWLLGADRLALCLRSVDRLEWVTPWNRHLLWSGVCQRDWTVELRKVGIALRQHEGPASDHIPPVIRITTEVDGTPVLVPVHIRGATAPANGPVPTIPIKVTGDTIQMGGRETAPADPAPTPIEGFLVVVERAAHLSRLPVAFTYHHTHRHLWFTTRWQNTTIPPVDGGVECHYAPLTVEHHQFTHLNGTRAEFEEADRAALHEVRRRMHIVAGSARVTDLADVVLVEPCAAVPAPAWGSELAAFVVRTPTGSTTYAAASEAVRDVWVRRLRAHVAYWTRHQTEEVREMLRVRQANAALVGVAPERWSAGHTLSWQHARLVASPVVHHAEVAARMSVVVVAGMLYEKARRTKVFVKRFVVVLPMHLVVFGWRKSGRHSRELAVPLKMCYVYSGRLSGEDLGVGELAYNLTDPELGGLPRVYPDGWRGLEEDKERVFTVWFGRKRAVAKEGEGPGRMELANRLGVTGKSVVFMARSQQERDMWVVRLGAAMERWEE